MKISIYGSGYVGLVTGLCFVKLGHFVTLYDIDRKKIQALTEGDPVIHEADLEPLLSEALFKKAVVFTSEIKKAVEFSNIHIICVGTPSTSDGSADLSYVYAAVEGIADHVTDSFILAVKSTVPVGTCFNLKNHLNELLAKKNKPIAFDIVFLPEFFQQGSAVSTFINPDRIVIGSESEVASGTIRKLYEPLLKKIPCVQISTTSAELSKYAANTFLATKISFINELSNIAEATGADIEEVRLAISHDPRIGRTAFPGCGFGGSCLPKDLKALISVANRHSQLADLLSSVLRVNERQKKVLFDKMKSRFQTLEGKTIAIWGLSFKPGTDDIRDAISSELIALLLNENVKIQAFDPVAIPNMKMKFPESKFITYCYSKEEALCGADGLAIVTEWPEFSKINLVLFKELMKTPVIFDGRNIFDQKIMTGYGIEYYRIGSKTVL